MYSAFGLCLSANRPIPGLTPRDFPSVADIHIQFDEAPFVADPADSEEQPYYVSDETDAPALQVWKAASGSCFRLRYADDTQFVVDAAGRHIRIIAPPDSTIEDSATYLLGPVLGFAMRLRGTTCLHASVVKIHDQAIAIAGPAGAGKSTAAASFAAMGYAVLADDIAALVDRDGALHVQPAYPQLRLWPDSVEMLYGGADVLPRLTPTWDKRALQLPEPRAFQAQSLPLGAIYVLGDRPDARDRAIDDVGGAERLRLLVANTYVGYLLDAPMRASEFECLVTLAATVPVRRVNGSVQFDQVSSVCTQLLECESAHV